MAEQTSINKRAFRNGGIISFIIAAIGLYQGETLVTALMTWIFAWVIVGAALWLSYRMTTPKTNSQTEDSDRHQT